MHVTDANGKASIRFGSLRAEGLNRTVALSFLLSDLVFPVEESGASLWTARNTEQAPLLYSEEGGRGEEWTSTATTKNLAV